MPARTAKKHAPGTKKKTAKRLAKPAVGTNRSLNGHASKHQAGKLVYLFGKGKTEGHGKMKELLGGKGANLAEMARIGLPVPPGFTITTAVCNAYYMERTGRRALDVGSEHRHVAVAGLVAQLEAVLDQRLLEGEGAAQHEGDEVVAPHFLEVGHFLDQFAILPDAVERDVGTDVEILAQHRQAPVAGLGLAE